MGVMLSKFWKKKSPLQELEEIEYKIRAIEAYNGNVKKRYRVVGRLLIYIVTLFTFAACAFAYFWKLSNVKEQLLFALFLLTLFLVTIYLKKIMSWYYDRKIKINRSKLFAIRETKKKIIEMVKEKEPYKIAKEILDKYSPEKVIPPNLTKNRLLQLSENRAVVSVAQKQPPSPLPATLQNRTPTGAISTTLPSMPMRIVPSTFTTRIDRFLEYLIGDGPTNRYALICNSCYTHNGLVLQEEFHYTGFRCCHCRVLNPPRMVRPVSPQLLDSTIHGNNAITGGIHLKGIESLVDNNEPETSGITPSAVTEPEVAVKRTEDEEQEQIEDRELRQTDEQEQEKNEDEEYK